ncbi:MAG: ABC transporter substrate-binding protein [Oscillospiraceae bacterium]|nr:ABC transporter substrate-binding protein [Oscillospiraceae bacterium]
MKKLIALVIALAMALALCACGASEPAAPAAPETPTDSSAPAAPVESNVFNLDDATWEQILEEAKGTTVTFYGWGGDELRNNWLDTIGADYMKEHYDITYQNVGMNIDEILAKLSAEKEAGSTEGSIDMIWINGENFFSAKENGLLYGPFTQRLPNTEKYIDTEAPETLADFCMPIENYEAPYGKAQMVMYNDSAVTPETPASAEEFMEYCKKYPGKVTYPALPDFTGSAFVRNLIYEICGWEQFQTMEADYDTVKAAIEPALEYLRELNPYLWNQGKSFPESSTTVDSMFCDGQLVMNMGYGPFAVASGIEQGKYTETTRTFVFDKGTIGNTNYMAIAFNSPNKAGAMVCINAMISAELQLSMYEELKGLPVTDPDKLSPEEAAAFDAVEIGKGVLTSTELLTHRLPEMPAKLVPVIEQIWLDEVVGK